MRSGRNLWAQKFEICARARHSRRDARGVRASRMRRTNPRREKTPLGASSASTMRARREARCAAGASLGTRRERETLEVVRRGFRRIANDFMT